MSAYAPSPTSTLYDFNTDEFNKTFSTVTTAFIVIPIVIGVGILVVIITIVCCCIRSQRRKEKELDAELAARTAAINNGGGGGVHREQAAILEEQQHVLMLSPAYSASVAYSNDSAPYAVLVPSAPTADAETQQYLQQINQQRQPQQQARPAAAAAAVTPQRRPQPPPQQPQKQQEQQQPWEDPLIVSSRIPVDALYTQSLLSKGGFGEVYKGSFRGEIVAIKKLLPETRRNLTQISGFFAEIKLMASMEHECIVKYIGVAWDALNDVRVVTEFMAGGDLRAVLTRFQEIDKRPQGLDEQKATIALHVAHALTYMHSLDPVVLHRDLKSKNILLDASLWNAKLTDFGISRERSDTTTMTAGVGTVLWMAPEVMCGDRYDDKADIFSFGIVLSELDTHAMPYADVKAQMVRENGRPVPDTALLQRIMAGRVSVSFSSGLRPDIQSLAKKCVAMDPHERPTAAQLLYELHKIVKSL